MFQTDDEDTNWAVALAIAIAVGVSLLVVAFVVALPGLSGAGASGGASGSTGGSPVKASSGSATVSATMVAPAPAAANAAAPAANAAAPAAGGTSAAAPAAAQMAKLYFELGQSGLPADTGEKLGPIIAALKADGAKKVALSGFHDASGDPAKNAELAKERAKSVRAALVHSGIDEARVEMRKPAQVEGGTDPKEARRVEVRVE
jgi:outer membrane protein OmpA-like peptidoglycan-associated protein